MLSKTPTTALLAGLLVARASFAATYYVDASAARDSGNGSQASPKKYIQSGISLMSSRGGDTLIIAGNPNSDIADQGALWGVYAFLEMQGVGSYLPDPSGDVFPSKPTLVVGEIDFTDAPWFYMRGGGNIVGGFGQEAAALTVLAGPVLNLGIFALMLPWCLNLAPIATLLNPFQLPLTGTTPLPVAQQWQLMVLSANWIMFLANLLPIWPLDGGQISRDFLGWFSPGNGLRISLGISFLFAAVLALHSVLAAYGRPLLPFLPFGGLYSAILFALLAIQSFQLMQQADWQRRHWHYD